jgi:hypothetical protein
MLAFTAVPRAQNGELLSFTPVWTVSGGIGTVDAMGTFYAKGCGTGRVIATRGYVYSGCVSGESIITINPTQGAASALASIAVSPNPKTLLVGEGQAFTATGYDLSGNPIAITPVWSVTGGIGNITQTGAFTATAVGQGNVVATVSPLSGQAGVTVEANGGQTTYTPVVTSILVLPLSTSVLVSEKIQFMAYAYDQNNNIMDFTPTWSVVNVIGTIESTGLFTATAEGTGKARASANNTYGEGSVSVTE